MVRILLGPGGVLGRHPAAADQLFIVVEGEGWVSGSEGERASVAAGAAVFWAEGEEHESGTDSGLTAIVVEAKRIVSHP